MQVEEDPSSQFVDFTNATATEQFVSDVEQALIAWQLANKGHASLEALAAAFPNESCASYATEGQASWSRLRGGSFGSGSANDPAIWTRGLEFRPAGQSTVNYYALTLFVSRHSQQQKALPSPSAAEGVAIPPGSGSSSRNRTLKKWQEGLEHFTPTMLSVADTGRDFQWGVDGDEPTGSPTTNASDMDGEEASAFIGGEDGHGHGGGRYTSVFDEEEAVFSRKIAFQNVQKWFGVDEFLFLSRSSHQGSKVPQPPRSNSSKPSIPATNLEADGGNGEDEEEDPLARSGASLHSRQQSGVDTNAEREVDVDEIGEDDDMADIQVDQNESGMLLSALTMALNNCNCTIPAFVPVLEPSRGTWVGSAVPGATGNVSIAFETDSVPELNPNQSCISGLLDFFKLKLQLAPHVEEKCRLESGEAGDLAIGMMVSASFGYSWDRREDPRETATPESPLSWRTLESQLPTHKRDQIQHITAKLFGDRHPTPLLGTASCPLTGMDLTVSWPKLREGTYVDNVVHSTLDPNTAPTWMLNVRFQDLLAENQRKPMLPLSKQLANLVQVYSNSRELNKDILVSELAPSINYPPPTSVAASPPKSSSSHTAAIRAGSGEMTATTASSSMAETIPAIPATRAAVVLGNAISSLVSAATWKGTDVEEIRRIVAELFDETEEEIGADGESDHSVKETATAPLETASSSVQHGAPVGELVSILATRMGQLHGINSMSLLWVEFVKALRDRWFQQRLLPFMSTATEDGDVDHNTSSRSLDALFLLDSEAMQLPPPDFRHCLLHQKLQLLNCCILRQAEVSRTVSNADDSSTHDNSSDQETTDMAVMTIEDTPSTGESVEAEDVGDEEGDGSPSDDEFFDSMEQQDSAQAPSPRAARHPEGVLQEVPGVLCLQTNEPLLDPVTQTAVPMTEDVAKQQQDLLTRLGVSVESAVLRQQIQSTALISDMQAFKAANPRSCLADFIRWYSPKDWLPFEKHMDPLHLNLPSEGRGVWWFEQHGMLSERMRFGPGHQHLWQQMWETSAAIPASRQKRLFDPLQESEKIYHYLETLSPHELFHQMLAGTISSSIFALETALPVRISDHTLPVVHRALQELRTRGSRAIARLDEALAESQVAFPAAGRTIRRREDDQEQQSKAAAHQGQQLQVAFEMALDACWKLVRALEVVEALVTKALALLHHFPEPKLERGTLELVNLLLLPSLSCRQQSEVSKVLNQEPLRQRVAALVLTNPTLATAGPMPVPVQREYVLRCICPRPFLREYYGEMPLDEEDEDSSAGQPDQELEESPLVVNRMYAAFKKSTVRFALALAESEF